MWVHTRRQVAATCRGDTLQRQIASCVLENFCENLCRRHKSHRFSLIWFFATCCSDQTLLRRQRFHKNSPVHTKRFVAATCRLTFLLQLVARPVHAEWSVAATCCSNLSPRLLHQYKWNTIQIRLPRLIIKAPYGLNVMTRPFLTFSQVPCREGRREVVLALIKDALYWPLPL